MPQCSAPKTLRFIAICFWRSVRRSWSGRRPAFRCWPSATAHSLSIINREATEFDDIADLVVRQDIGTVLESFIVH